jgi:EAL domain-containing protein (putative c-di-GMP-specific phosphodiesterase class I)
VGMEALLRWKHPKLGLVAPDRFIRVAENTGLILPIGEWVLRTACSELRNRQAQGFPILPVSVNVSAVQFRQEGFCSLVRRVLQECGLQPQYLELELTETLLLSGADLTLPLLREFKAMGVQLAIDDFGTGYSSLSYLRHFPVTRLKIDRSFIKTVASNSDDAAITAAIISMGKSLNLKVIAEGVETEEQMAFLRSHKCDEIQGFYYSRPVCFEEAANCFRKAAGASAGARCAQ